MIRETTPTCFAAHLGVWACEPKFFMAAVASVRSGLFRPAPRVGPWQDTPSQDVRRGPGYAVQDGVAVIDIIGPMSKVGASKFGETSTVDARRALRAAAADESVRSILLRIDSPGGHVAGTADLADEVLKVGASKPVDAYIEDMGASAAYWVASQARTITANRLAQVGSIGAFTVLEDSSKAAADAGVDVKVIQTGPNKAIGVPGAPITPEQVAIVQAEVDAYGQAFFAAVSSGRGIKGAALTAVTDGSVWMAPEAKRLGLIDAVRTMDEVMGSLAQGRSPAPRPRRAAAEARIRFL